MSIITGCSNTTLAGIQLQPSVWRRTAALLKMSLHPPQARREAEKQASKETRLQEELRSYKQVMQVGVVMGQKPTRCS